MFADIIETSPSTPARSSRRLIALSIFALVVARRRISAVRAGCARQADQGARIARKKVLAEAKAVAEKEKRSPRSARESRGQGARGQLAEEEQKAAEKERLAAERKPGRPRRPAPQPKRAEKPPTRRNRRGHAPTATRQSPPVRRARPRRRPTRRKGGDIADDTGFLDD